MAQHLVSICLITLTTDLVCTSFLVNLVNTSEIPWENLLAILLDSFNAMRDCKSGVKTKIRKNFAPCKTFIVIHLLIDNLFAGTPTKTLAVLIGQMFVS